MLRKIFFTNSFLFFISIFVVIILLEILLRLLGFEPWNVYKSDLNEPTVNKYDSKTRLLLSRKFCKFAKFITDQNINLIFAIVGLMNEPRNWNRKNIDNYIEIYIKSELNKIIRLKKKKIYHSKKKQKIVGLNIKPEFPKNPDITIVNNFKKSIDSLSKELLREIKKI